MNLSGLYVITDERLTPFSTILTQVAHAIEGGAKIVQFRYKSELSDEVIKIASQLAKLCKESQTLFIVNDHVELALNVDADGVHVGLEDWEDLTLLRAKMGDKIIGVSCYGDIQRAILAEKNGANYVAFGAFFTSPTKPHAKTIPFEIIPQAKSALHIPICAIGGITFANSQNFYNHGCDMVAMISDVWR